MAGRVRARGWAAGLVSCLHSLLVGRRLGVIPSAGVLQEALGSGSVASSPSEGYSGSAPSEQALVLSPAFAPFPAKLVQRIRAGEFVEMRDLLPDNITLLQRLAPLRESLEFTTLTTRSRLREVNSIQTWVYCFLAYVAIRTTDPMTRNMLTYARLVLREAARMGGRGWQAFDVIFRQNAAAASGRVDWTSLDPSLTASTFCRERDWSRLFCAYCSEGDHTKEACALASLLGPADAPSSGQRSLGSRQRSSRTRSRSPTSSRGGQGPPVQICASWNSGRCRFPGTCNYSHRCSLCSRAGVVADHRAKDCRRSAGDKANGN